MQHYEQSKTPVLLKNVIVHLVQVIGWLTTNQQHICVQILMSPLSAKLHPNLSQQPQSGQLQTLLLNSSWPLQQTRKMMFLGHCPLGTKNQIKLWSQLLTLKKTVYWRKALEQSLCTLWDPLINQVKTVKSYMFTNLSVKYYQGSTFLSSSPLTIA